MAGSVSPLTLASSLKVSRETDFNATEVNDLFNSGGASTLALVKIDNTANAAQSVYAKFFNGTTGTAGTSAPDIIIPAAGGATVTVSVHRSSSPSTAFATGISAWCVTAGGTAGTTNPTSDVVLAAVGT
jgi:hypothetical protein